MPRPGLNMARFLVLTVLLAVFPSISGEQVPPPLNLTVHAVNTDYKLHWAWSGREGQTPTFSVQWVGKYQLKRTTPNWKTACEETSDMSCDLRPQQLHYLGIYRLRVRAKVGGLFSEWVPIDFAPAQDAAVGPPGRVVVSTDGSALDVSISEPQTSENTSMKEKISSLYYRYMYWERSAESQSPQVRTIQSTYTMVVLEELKSWTWYCVSVQSRSTNPDRNSSFTTPVCRQTQGGVPWWQIFLYFLASLVAAFLLVLGTVLLCYNCRRVFKKSRIPHPVFIDQYLNVSPELLRSDWQSEEQFDPVTVSPDPALIQIHAASSSQHQEHFQELVNSSGRHSRQSSGGSRDSGVYSTKSTSDQGSAPGSMVSSGLSSGSQAGSGLGEMRLQDICTAPEKVQLIPDEGFGSYECDPQNI